MHILLTRPLEDCSEMILKFKSLGHQVSHLPLLTIEKMNYEKIKFLEYGGIIFTSANAIKFLNLNELDKNITCFCVGNITEKKARAAGFQTRNVMADDFGFEIPVEAVPLPTNGRIYPVDSPLHGIDTLEIRAMTAKEEDILSSRALIQQGTVISHLIRSCLIDKSIEWTSFDVVKYIRKSLQTRLKVKKIKVIGNLKLIEHTDDKKDNIGKKLRTEFKKYKLWTAASTHMNEEVFCAKTHIELKKKIKNLITIIIPRHINRVEDIISQISNLNLKVVKHSSNNRSLKNVDIYIVDTFGETKKFFKISNTVFIGGTLANKGGQNPLEAARYGSKIIHGPNIDNFLDVFFLLKKLGITKEVNSINKLASEITFKKKTSGTFKLKKIGRLILKKTLKELKPFIENEPKKT